MKRRARSASLTRHLSPMALLGGRPNTLIFVILSLITLGYSAARPQSAYGIRVSVTDLVSPIINAVSHPIQEAALFVRNVTGLAALQAENMLLYQENIRLREWHQAAQFYEAENERLRALLNLEVDAAQTYVSARILADTGSSFARSLLVAAGQESGVKKGQAVITGSGVIGRIVEAGEKVSRVLLLNDMNSRVPVMIEGSGAQGILAGQNDDRPRIERLPLDYKIEEGARVLTSGVGGLYPPNLPVGRIEQTRQGPRVVLYADVNRLIYVRIVENTAHSVLQNAQER